MCLLVFKSRSSGMTLPGLSVRPQAKKEMRTNLCTLAGRAFNGSFLLQQCELTQPSQATGEQGRRGDRPWEAGFADEQVVTKAL